MHESTLFLDDQLGLRIVNLALMKGLITPEEWSAALADQAAESGPGRTPRPLCLILLQRGTLTRDQLHRLRADAEARPKAARRPGKAPLLEGNPVKFGKYRLFRELGRGARGTVYEAVDSLGGRRVALKILAAVPAVSSDEVSRDERTFLAAAEIPLRLPPHPGVARLLEAGVAQGRRYLATEFVDGPDLEAWTRGDLRARVDLLRQAAEAVHHAHERGVAHLGLSDRNILVDGKGRARVADFALARMTGGTARPGLDRRPDVLALGELLRRMTDDPSLIRVARNADRIPSAACFANELLRWMEGTRARAGRSWRRVACAAAVLAATIGLLCFGRGPAETGVELLPEARGARVLPAGSSPLGADPEGLRIRPDASGESRLALDLDEAWSAGTEIAEVEVEYFDGGPGGFRVLYDSTDEDGAHKTAGSVTLQGTNAWVSWTSVLANPRFFNRQGAGGDLLIIASGDLRIRRLALRRRTPESLPRLHPGPAKAGSAVLRVEARGVYVFEGADGVSAARLEPGLYALDGAPAVYAERGGRRVAVSP